MAKTPVYNLSSVSDAQTCGIRHIGIGVYSSGKIREYLRHKGFESSVCDEAVKCLVKREYIDDCRAGRKVLLSRSGKKQESHAMLYQRLMAAGINRASIDILLSEVEEDVDLCFNLYLSIKPFIDEGDDIDKISLELQKVAAKRGFGMETSRSAFRLWLKKVMND
ncbi:MAG: RecX family transcriptional regulator [Saccharofermentans sp.]|nr:RecX family transcriptional regulator [Saccharofermentans sp.]